MLRFCHSDLPVYDSLITVEVTNVSFGISASEPPALRNTTKREVILVT